MVVAVGLTAVRKARCSWRRLYELAGIDGQTALRACASSCFETLAGTHIGGRLDALSRALGQFARQDEHEQDRRPHGGIVPAEPREHAAGTFLVQLRHEEHDHQHKQETHDRRDERR